jgi:hypothetical protein
MSFMTNGWYLPHHVLNDSSIMILGLLVFFSFMIRILIINSVIYLKISTSEWRQQTCNKVPIKDDPSMWIC